jgi:hypothetical protein
MDKRRCINNRFQICNIYKTKAGGNSEFKSLILPILIKEEVIIHTFRVIGDSVIFTNKRIISIILKA